MKLLNIVVIVFIISLVNISYQQRSTDLYWTENGAYADIDTEGDVEIGVMGQSPNLRLLREYLGGAEFNDGIVIQDTECTLSENNEPLTGLIRYFPGDDVTPEGIYGLVGDPNNPQWKDLTEDTLEDAGTEGKFYEIETCNYDNMNKDCEAGLYGDDAMYSSYLWETDAIRRNNDLNNPVSASFYNAKRNQPIFAFGYSDFGDAQRESTQGVTVVACGNELCSVDNNQNSWRVFDVDGVKGPPQFQNTLDGTTYMLATEGESLGYYPELSNLYLYRCVIAGSNPGCTKVSSTPRFSDVYTNYQLIIDQYDQFHYFGYHRYNNTINLQYTFCVDETVDDGKCSTRSLNSYEFQNEIPVKMTQVSGNFGYPMIKALYETLGQNDQGRIVIVAFEENNHQQQSLTNSDSIFRIYECNGFSRESQYSCDFDTSYPVPRSNDLLRIRGIVDWFDVELKSSDTTGNVYITYSYRTGALNQPGGEVDERTRSEPDNEDKGDLSSENFVVRSIACHNAQCTLYTTRQIVGSNSIFNAYGSAIPRGLKLVLNENINNGNPVIAFSTGASQSSYLFNSHPFINNYYGGKIGVISCHDYDCISASFISSSELLSGHAGNFEIMGNARSFILGSPQRRGANKSPVFQRFLNNVPAPEGNPCSSDNAGALLVVDDVVYTCSRINNGLAGDSTNLWMWSPVVPEIRSLHTAVPYTITSDVKSGCVADESR